MNTVLTKCGDKFILSSFFESGRLIGTAQVSAASFEQDKDSILQTAKPETRN